MSATPLPIADQRRFWNDWNAATRERETGDIENRQRQTVCGWLEALGRTDLDIIDVGCGAGWLCVHLTRFGHVTGTDLADEVLERARLRVPSARFLAGDFTAMDFGSERFDVAVSLEVLSHVADQPAFIRRLRDLLRPGGLLMLATQNGPVLHRFNRVPPPGAGQIRQWVDRHRLRELLEAEFEVIELRAVSPRANRGPMRLVCSRTARSLTRRLTGVRLEPVLERLWLGWTLMALARRPSR